jgi:tRNA-dihydrouridine synthase B
MSSAPSVADFVVPERTAPFRLADLPWAHRTSLAPMEGVTNHVFRALIAARGGVGIVCTEFVRIGRSPLNPSKLRSEVIPFPGVPLSVQVMGNEVERMAEAASVIAAAGADVVDINLGCPAPRVVRKGVGSAMLKNPQLLYEVLCAMRAAVPGLLSAKIRAGFDDADHVVRIARTVEAAGADFIAVHPRRRADFYEGVADWRIIRVLRDALQIPVIGNGDCWYAEDALRMREETGCHAVMIGRPSLRNPWIFSQIEALEAGRTPHAPDGEEAVAWMRSYVDRYREAYPEHTKGPVGRLKEMITYFGRAVRDENAFRHAALRLQTTDEILALAEREIGSLRADTLDLAAWNRWGVERSGSAVRAA